MPYHPFRLFIPQITTVALLLLLLAGCATPRAPLEAPSFRLAGVAPLGIGLFEQQFRLTIRVDNPNDLSLPIRSMRYQLKLADVDFASGLTSKDFTLPAQDSTTFEVDVTTNLSESLPRLMRLIGTQGNSLDYTLSGEVEYGRFIRGQQPFEQKGRLQLNL